MLRVKDIGAAVHNTSIRIDIFSPEYNYQYICNRKFSGHTFL